MKICSGSGDPPRVSRTKGPDPDPLCAETQAGRGPPLLRHRHGDGAGRPRVRHPDRGRPGLRALWRAAVCQGSRLANRADGRSL